MRRPGSWPTRWAGPTRCGRSSPRPSGCWASRKFEPGLDHLDLARSAPLDAALARPDRDDRPAAVDGRLVGAGPERRAVADRPARPAQALGRAVRADRGPAPVQDPAARQPGPARPAAAARRPGRRRRRRRGLARAPGRPGAPADRGADRRRDQAVPLRRRGRPRPPGRAGPHPQARDGGTLYLTTSRRTRPDVVAALEAACRRARCSIAGRPRPRPTIPISACWPTPTGSSSPATASR